MKFGLVPSEEYTQAERVEEYLNEEDRKKITDFFEALRGSTPDPFDLDPEFISGYERKIALYLIEKIKDESVQQSNEKIYFYVSWLDYVASEQDSKELGNILNLDKISSSQDRSSKSTVLETLERVGTAESLTGIKLFAETVKDFKYRNGSASSFNYYDIVKAIDSVLAIQRRENDKEKLKEIEDVLSSLQVILDYISTKKLEPDSDEDYNNDEYNDDFYYDDVDLWDLEDEPIGPSNSANFGDSLATISFLQRIHALEEEIRLKFEGDDFIFFEEESERYELFKYTQSIVDYVRQERVSDLVIIDRSSRPLYIAFIEYWRNEYPQEPMPGIYFMNPKGFKSKDEYSARELEEIALECTLKDDASEEVGRVRTRGEILEELKTTYKRLMENKDKPILVFDSCIHSGDTLSPLKQTMEDAGFSDLRIGSINPSDYDSKVKTDFFVSTRVPTKGCYPFDRDRLIEKTFDHIYSKRTSNAFEIMKSHRLRREIARVIKEELSLRVFD
jgi:hypothetical protein